MKTRVLCTVLALWTGMAFAQATGQDQGGILGRVTDATGEPLPGANVVAQSPAMPGTVGAITNIEGVYRIENLPVGMYQITVSFIGYRTAIRKDVRIEAGSAAEVNFVLQSEAIRLQEQIVISASRRQEKALESPASVAIVEAEEIRDRSALSVAEYVKAAPAVDHAQTGLAQSNTVVRGFNNVFSGALMVLVDNRIAWVPSLRVNVQNFIPLTGEDIERIELVLGPGSALYGPNSANGVMHIITRSPFGSEGTTVSVGGGERSLRTFSLRHAGSVNSRVGYKISGQYYAGTDWKYEDPTEVRVHGSNPRNYDLERKTGEVRFDFRPTDEFTAIVSAGYTEANNIELTGLGAAQADGWKYTFLQTRVTYREWFAQIFYNRNDAGNTTLLSRGSRMVDKSSLMVFQLQHAVEPVKRQRFTYGVDVLRTRPKTEGTINGANEDKDNIDEYGFYLQSQTTLGENLDLVLAGRIDDHNHIENPVFSPRAALVIKPVPGQTLRLTYNRAFSTPTSNQLFLDLIATPDAFKLGANFQPVLGFSPNIDVRTQGVANGFTFNRDADGLPTFRSSFAPVAGLSPEQHIPLHDPQFTNIMWGIGRGAVLNAFLPTFKQAAAGAVAQQLIAAGVPADQAQTQGAQQAEVLAVAFDGIVPKALPGLKNTMRTLNLKTQGFDPVQDPAKGVTDILKMKPTITQTFEAGYKGVINNKLLVSADLYRTRTKDFVGPLRVETPNVFLDPDALTPALAASFSRALQDPSAAQLATALTVLDAPQQGGNGNGTAVDELTRLFVAGAASIPYGTVSPEQANDPAAVMLTYRNFGEVTLYGLDLGFGYYPNTTWSFSGNYSFVSKDLFKNLDGIGDIALNAPRNKFSLGAAYRAFPFRLSGRLRVKDAFPMNSGVYVGDIESHTVFDLNLAYDLPLSASNATMTFSLNASNLFNNKHQSFIGAPEVGRLVSGGMTVRF